MTIESQLCETLVVREIRCAWLVNVEFDMQTICLRLPLIQTIVRTGIW